MVLNQPNALPSPIGAAASPATGEGSGSSSRGPTTPFKPLHNFPLQDLRWPMSQSRNNRTSPPDTEAPPAPAVEEAESKKPGKILIRLVRTRVADDGAPAAEVVVAPPPPSPPRPPVPAGDDVEGDEADDDKMMVAEVGEDGDDEEVGPKTWNLRPRKAVTKPPPPPGAGHVGPRGGKDGGGGEAKKKVKVIEKEKDEEIAREKKEKAKEEKEKVKEEKREKERVRREKLKEQRRNSSRRDKQEEEMVGVPSFSLSLTKDQIELDFLAMTGSKPPRRPKRRPKHIQKQLDNVFPGLWLDSITPDTYKVDEPEPKPRI